MRFTSAVHRVLRTLRKRRSVVGKMSESGTQSTYSKDIHDHKLAFACTGCHKASENKSTTVHSDSLGHPAKFFRTYRTAHHGTFVVRTAPFTWLHTRRAGFPAWLFAFAMAAALSARL